MGATHRAAPQQLVHPAGTAIVKRPGVGGCASVPAVPGHPPLRSPATPGPPQSALGMRAVPRGDRGDAGRPQGRRRVPVPPPTSLVRRVLHRYRRSDGGTWATVVAWNTFFAFFPIVLVVVTLLGVVLHDPQARRLVEDQVAAAFPSCRTASTGRGSCGILDALHSFRQRTGEAGAVAFVGLLWSGSGLFGAIDRALAALYGCQPRPFVRQKLMAVGMIGVFTLLTIPVVVSSSLLSLVDALPAVPHRLRGGVLSWVLQVAVGAGAASALFFAIYRIVPSHRPSWRHALPGALLAGGLFEGFTLLFPVYFRLTGGFAAYGQSFALAFLLLVFSWAVGHIVVLGGALNAELSRGQASSPPLPPGGPHRGTPGQRR